VNVCPHCGSQPCLPLWRKLCLGPAGSAHCEVCGCRVGVDVARACLALLPTFLLVVVAAFGLVSDPVVLVLLLLVCLGATFTLYAVWVPLMPDELSNARIVEAGRARIAAGKPPAKDGWRPRPEE
jgi:hypothetical protein